GQPVTRTGTATDAAITATDAAITATDAAITAAITAASDTKHLPSTCRDASSAVCIETPPTAFYKNT
ncbi:TPA: hypothetical protein ACTC0T_000451, partial [Neisseria meningitidis]